MIWVECLLASYIQYLKTVIHGLPTAWAPAGVGKRGTCPPWKIYRIDSLQLQHFGSHKKNQNRCINRLKNSTALPQAPSGFKGLLRSGEGTAEWREQQRRERKDERGRGKRVRDGDEREGVDSAPVAPPPYKYSCGRHVGLRSENIAVTD